MKQLQCPKCGAKFYTTIWKNTHITKERCPQPKCNYKGNKYKTTTKKRGLQ